jgi:predicted  nucleic acid-binding Zn-ribbon protein
MKSKTLGITLLSIAVLAVGCNQEPTTSQQIDKAQTETATAARDMKDYAFAQKAEFVTKMQGQLDALNKDLDQLSAKIEASRDAIKTDAKPRLKALRDQSAGLTKQLDNARNATESTWESVKATSQKAFDSAQDGFQQARQWLSDKIQP